LPTPPYYVYRTTVSVLIGNGDGTLGAPANFVTAAGPNDVAVGDVNGDGKPDLAVACLGANVVSLLPGDGSGGFGPKSDVSAGAGPGYVAIGDLNRDGKLDLGVASSGYNQPVRVLLGDGAGGFGGAISYTTGNYPSSLAIADLNSDLIPDLAITGLYSNAVSVLVGNGTGSFGGRVDYGVGGSPRYVAIGELNDDGKLDMVTADQDSGIVTVLLNTGPSLPVAVEPGPAAGFALHGATPNPAWGRLHVTFSLADAQPASIELYDVSGRRLVRRSLGGLGSGRHTIDLDARVLPPGLYMIRLNQGRRVSSLRAAVVR
jgi:hypothetical protein